MGTVAGILSKCVADVLGYNIVVVDGDIGVLAPVSGIPASGDHSGPEQEHRLDSHNERYRSVVIVCCSFPEISFESLVEK
jgi:hypothetical protein